MCGSLSLYFHLGASHHGFGFLSSGYWFCASRTPFQRNSPGVGNKKGTTHTRESTLWLVGWKRIKEHYQSQLRNCKNKKETDGEQYENINVSCLWNHQKQINAQRWAETLRVMKVWPKKYFYRMWANWAIYASWSWIFENNMRLRYDVQSGSSF